MNQSLWLCPHCGEVIEVAFDSCWKCGTGRDGLPPENPQVYTENPAPTGAAFDNPCPICGGIFFSWRNGLGDFVIVYETVSVRCCNACGNLQLFAREFLEQPRK